MVMDFEMASKHALLREFPGVNIWVFFHFCQCVYKHVQIDIILHMINKIKIKDFMSLAFVSVTYVMDTFARLLEVYMFFYPTFMQQPVVTEFIFYFFKQWVANPNISLDTWNVYNLGRVQTNSAMEGYHLRLLIQLGLHKPI